MKFILFCIAVLYKGILFSQSLISGEDLIKTMHATYKDKWYKNFTFTQDAIFYKDGKADKKEVWYEAAAFPGNLVIKYDSLHSKNGVIFSHHQVTGIKDGIIKKSKPFIHDLLLVGFDIYFLPPEKSIHWLDSLGYNLKLIREDYFDGRKVYVAGAEKGNENSNQFWIDKERLYMHRIIYKKGEILMDVVFSDYDLIDHNWVAKKVLFKQNGQLSLIEQYYNIQFPENLKADLFIPEKFAEAEW